jgi:uncharacterized phiE125 gp8 family phage protein
MGLVRTVEPQNWPVTLDEARKQLSLPAGIPSHDQHVQWLIETATDCAETATWRALITQTWRLTLQRFPCVLFIPRPPLQSLTIEYIDTDGILQTLDNSLYEVATDGQPAYVVPAYNQVWPATRCHPEAVRVTLVAGYGDDAKNVPQRIRHGIRLMIGNWFANRESVVVGNGLQALELPQSASWLLESFKTGAAAEWFLPDDTPRHFGTSGRILI